MTMTVILENFSNRRVLVTFSCETPIQVICAAATNRRRAVNLKTSRGSCCTHRKGFEPKQVNNPRPRSSQRRLSQRNEMANIIFAERENAGLHAPTLKMRQRLQSAPEKQGKSPMKPFSTPLPSGRKAFGCLNVQVSTPAVNKQEQKLLKKQPPVYQEETKVQHAPQANTEYPEPEKFIPYDPLEYLRYDIPEDLIPLSKLALPGLACFTQAPDLCEDDFQELAPLPNPPPVLTSKSSDGCAELDAFLQTLEELTVELPPEPDTDF